jgi:Mn-dependent DtxR family transcriptional regulator
MKNIKTAKGKNMNFTEENVLRLLHENGYISTAMIQQKFTVGYSAAARMIDTLAENGCIKHDGERWVSND